jgi:hypothetical protein
MRRSLLQKRNANKISFGIPEEKRHVEGLSVDGKIILK